MWYHFKDVIGEFSGISRDALHVHVGLFVFLIVAAWFRNNPRSLLYGCLVVLAAQTINEALDLLDWYRWARRWTWEKSLTDYVHTMLWPIILLVLASRQSMPSQGSK